MARFSAATNFVLCFCLAATLSRLHVEAQAVNTEGNLTLEEVVKLAKAGFSEDIIITKIKKNAKPFDLSTEELLDLKKEGVSDNVIRYLLDPSLPYSPPAPSTPPVTSKPPEPGKKYPADPYASRVPTEPGFYVVQKNTVVKADLKLLLGTEEPKTLMKKGKTLAYLPGSTSETQLTGPAPLFYVRLPEGKEIEELVLVCLTSKNGRREIDFGPKQAVKAENTRQRDVLEVGPRLYRVSPVKPDPGEYFLLYIGSAEPPKGIFGKGYDFTIKSAVPPKAKT